ncbi:MAG: signal peptidase [Aeromicrobium sp.]|nr:signal peptidase [Aeromicrobium sp.]
MSTSHLRTQRRPAARIASTLVNVLLVVVTLAGIGYLAPALFGYERYVITGGSMSGTFEKGAIAFERPVPVGDVQVGDVITYQPPADSGVATLVTHRVVSIKQLDTGARQFQTQGDANPDPDPWKFQLVSGDQPVVEQTVPMVGYAVIALADREIRMAVIGIPAAIIALMALIELGRGLKPSARRNDTADAPEAATSGARVLTGV